MTYFEEIKSRYINLTSNDVDISLFDFPNTRQVLEDIEFLLGCTGSTRQCIYTDGPLLSLFEGNINEND